MSKRLPEPSRMTRQLLRMRSEEDRDSLVMAEAGKVPEEYVPSLQVQTFTNINTLFSSDYHALLEGKTGSGKTTLLLTLMKKFLERDSIVLLRDDGGLEFMYLACYFPTRIFIPNHQNVTLELEGFKADVVPFDHPREIIHQTWDYTYPLNVIVYDVFCDTTTQRAKFYSKLFMTLINSLQRMRKHYKQKVVLGIDELNDLIPPRGKGSPALAFSRADIEMNMRKIRKHKVQIVASSHRFNQIGVDTRSQMEQIYFKKSYGYDVWDFLSKNLVTSNSKTFWGMLRRLISLERNEFVLFDENRKFDLYTFKDIPRPPKIDVEALGSLPTTSSKQDDKWKIRYYKWVKFLKGNPIFLKTNKGFEKVNVRLIAKKTGLTHTILYNDLKEIECKA